MSTDETSKFCTSPKFIGKRASERSRRYAGYQPVYGATLEEGISRKKFKADKRKKIIVMAKDMEELDKIKRLEKENARFRQENNLLKKWQRYLPEAHQNELDLFRDTDKTSE